MSELRVTDEMAIAALGALQQHGITEVLNTIETFAPKTREKYLDGLRENLKPVATG
jgi:hypothetical protein